MLRLKDFPYSDPLLIFRGDAINPTNGAKVLATKTSVPVVAFTDLDPQGLNIANSLPNVIGAIFPAETELEGSDDLFITQRHLLGAIEKYPSGWHSVIQNISAKRRCISQEYMLARGSVCRLYMN